jgi:hypothetical protein
MPAKERTNPIPPNKNPILGFESVVNNMISIIATPKVKEITPQVASRVVPGSSSGVSLSTMEKIYSPTGVLSMGSINGGMNGWGG